MNRWGVVLLVLAGSAIGFTTCLWLFPPESRPALGTDPREVGLSTGWLVFGFAAQALFMSRMLVQWLASERARASVIPTAFWWLSLVGGLTLLIYFLRRGDPVGAAGQLLGIVVYVRNLVFIRRIAQQPSELG